MSEIESNFDILLEQPIPELSARQLAHFNKDTLLAGPSGRIEVLPTAAVLLQSAG